MTTNHCTRPPAGWHCTRNPNHDGPCAAWPILEIPVTDARLEIELDAAIYGVIHRCRIYRLDKRSWRERLRSKPWSRYHRWQIWSGPIGPIAA